MSLKIKIGEKKFGEQLIFEDTEFEIRDGEFVAVKGPSGSGKTTLIKMIGFLEPFAGEYQIDGQAIELKKSEQSRKKYITYIFQDDQLISYYSVMQNVVMPLKNLREKIDYDYINICAEILSISSLLDKNVAKLSGGEKQRVAILRALATNRPIILADEPTGSLDSENVKSVMELLKIVNEKLNKTIIMVTHADNLNCYFGRILEIKGNKIV